MTVNRGVFKKRLAGGGAGRSNPVIRNKYIYFLGEVGGEGVAKSIDRLPPPQIINRPKM